MSRVGRRRRSRGQSLIESALVLPIIVLITLGCTDMAQAYRYATDVAGASRAGMRVGIMSDATDIAAAVRDEPNSVVANTVTDWGDDGSQQSYDKCTSGSATCGDPAGCARTSAFWTAPPAGQPDPIACFAVRSCVLNSTLQCTTTFGAWGTRPGPSASCGLEVVVVYRLVPVTPVVAGFAGGAFYLTATTQGLALYTCS